MVHAYSLSFYFFSDIFIFSDSFDVFSSDWPMEMNVVIVLHKTVSNPCSHCRVLLAYRLWHRFTYSYFSCRRSRIEGVVITCKRYKANRKCVKESNWYETFFSSLFSLFLHVILLIYLFIYLFSYSWHHSNTLTHTRGQSLEHRSSDPRSSKSCKICMCAFWMNWFWTFARFHIEENKFCLLFNVCYGWEFKFKMANIFFLICFWVYFLAPWSWKFVWLIHHFNT